MSSQTSRATRYTNSVGKGLRNQSEVQHYSQHLKVSKTAQGYKELFTSYHRIRDKTFPKETRQTWQVVGTFWKKNFLLRRKTYGSKVEAGYQNNNWYANWSHLASRPQRGAIITLVSVCGWGEEKKEEDIHSEETWSEGQRRRRKSRRGHPTEDSGIPHPLPERWGEGGGVQSGDGALSRVHWISHYK